MTDVKARGLRSYVSKPNRGRRSWKRNPDAQMPTYANRRSIMGGFNQPQAHAQFISNIVDHGMNIQQALEAGRFTKGSFDGCDVNMEVMVPAWVRAELTALGHEITVRPPRTGTFGYGQAVMGNGTGVQESRHDGMAMPQPVPVFGNGGP